jgi:CheY-like chemotaxis protein
LSLTGNLEDLPLLDILQIVSFSKKTGNLSIRTGEGEGGIVFREGFVVAAFNWDSVPLDPRFGALPEAQRSSVIRSRIEIALEQLVRLREGQFSFSLNDAPPRALGGRDLNLETLATGINPQELLLDLARGIDEDRRNSTALVEASFAQPDETSGDPAADREADAVAAFVRTIETPAAPETPARRTLSPTPPIPVTPPAIPSRPPSPPAAAPPLPTPPRPPSPPAAPAPASAPARRSPAPTPAPLPEPATAPEARTLLLVDDEEEVRRILADWFKEGGYEVVEAEDPESAVKKGGKLGKAGVPFLLVTDLGMPTSGGSSFHGGFEVVKRLWKMNLRPPVLMMTESLNPSLQLRAQQMGIKSFVFKPGLSKLNPRQFEADLLAFANKILVDILPRMGRGLAPAPAPKATPPGAAPAAQPEPSPPTHEELSRQFTILQRRLLDLREPADANQIAILVMKVAREFFERAILFLVKNDEARGLGGFGAAPKGENINLLVREVVIPLNEPSFFQDAVQAGKPLLMPLPKGRWSAYLMGKIGRFQSGTVALLPLVTHRETIALLFGDNPETGREFGRLEALEVFIDQAGVALENAFLQRKLQSLQNRT